MDKEDLFKDIPKDRNDECCPKCGRGWLQGTGGFREVKPNFIQMTWKCKYCGEQVVTIDEKETEDCPLCGTPGVFSKSRLKEIKKEYNI
jgi:DNA-directed RNA polymerase subunit RPC12/RpoP